MAKSLPITADVDAFLPVRNTIIKGVLLCAGTGANAVIEIYDAATVAAGASAGSSVVKLAAVTNESAAPICCDILTTNGVSVDITGAGAKAFLIYD